MWFLDSPQMNLMTKSLDALWLKQRVISDNIANKDTPFYKAKYVEFAETLKREQKKGTQRNEKAEKEDIVLAQVKVKNETSLRADQNNVNMDKEALEMDITSIQYEFLTRQISSHLAGLRSVIKGGR